MSDSNTTQELLDAAPDAMVLVDRYGHVTAVNREAERLLGWSGAELVGGLLSRFIPTRFQALLGADVIPNAQMEGMLRCFALRRDGSEAPVELERRPVGAETNAHSLITMRDLTQWRRAREMGPRAGDQALQTLDALGDALVTADCNGMVTYLNPSAERLTGWGATEALGHPLDEVFHLISETTRQPVEHPAGRCLEEGPLVSLESGVLLQRRDGSEVPIDNSTAPIRGRDGVVIGEVLVFQDESEKRQAGQLLSYEATHDALTGLINRREFERRLTRVVGGLADSPSDQVLLFLDLDRFKAINDTCGHDAGDDLLKCLGPLLAGHLRKRDTLARLGGDEFGVLLENCPLPEAQRIAENIRADIEAFRFERAGRTFTIGASIGLLPVEARTGTVAAVLRAADAACYSAKGDGGNRVHCEAPGEALTGMSLPMARRVTRLARAVDEGHFQLYVQPIVALQLEMAARPRYEVLLRLPDGNGRMQAAADFLPQATRYNLMPSIDRWVVRETVSLLGQWRRDHPEADLPVWFINLSPTALTDDGLLPVLEQRLSRHDIPPESLCFEIAETAALANLPRTVRFLSALRTMGCAVALEDFGNGVTSFTHLKTLPVNFLKVGGPFVRGIDTDPMYGSIIGAISQVGRSMGIHTIAKQVGSEPVLQKLRTLGVGYAQGRALTPPVPLTNADGRVMMRGLKLSA